ncbi:hypothetical protein BD770DRAFT_450049 [Pilaira anomala]|nr:hypothetical protein BD770DRAFT_450049 [Pilaira anomala]
MDLFDQTFTASITNAVVFFHRIMPHPNRNHVAIAYMHNLNSSVILDISEDLFIGAVAEFMVREGVNLKNREEQYCVLVNARGRMLTTRTFSLLDPPVISPRNTLVEDEFRIVRRLENNSGEVLLLERIFPAPVVGNTDNVPRTGMQNVNFATGEMVTLMGDNENVRGRPGARCVDDDSEEGEGLGRGDEDETRRADDSEEEERLGRGDEGEGGGEGPGRGGESEREGTDSDDEEIDDDVDVPDVDEEEE